MSQSHHALPRTHDVEPLRDRFLRVVRPGASALLRRWYDIHIHEAHHVPRQGPVLLAPNHVGYLDGPLLVITAPRTIHAMIKREMFTGVLKPILQAGGQIPLDRFHVDPLAVKRALRVLRDGKALAIYPEGSRGAGDGRFVKRGWAYLATVTGAPVVPVAVFGSRLPGTSVSDLPPRGHRVDVVYGAPITVNTTPWPRRSADILALTEDLQKRFMEHIEQAQLLSGGTLPGWAPDDEGPEPGSIVRSDAVSDEHRDADELRDPAGPDPDATPGGTR
ncbi:MAG TPA: lysophospholipid acyltransferase family protein [Nocardioidaceae bacterium]|nr:lysophospholipid acyltransferase family protein [Nocardioidaceae bacterium]